MTLAEVKTKVGINRFDLQLGKDADGVINGWLRHWDNDRKIAVIIHDDVVKAIQADPEFDKLGLKHAIKTTKTGKAIGTEYTQYMIVHARSIAVSI